MDEVGVVIRLCPGGRPGQEGQPRPDEGRLPEDPAGDQRRPGCPDQSAARGRRLCGPISKGDIPEKIAAEYHGDFNNIKNNLNNCIAEMGVLVDEVGVVIRLAREGDLAKRANPDRTKGVYRKILRGINDALDALINPLHVAADYVDRISKGDIPEKITAEYHGDFNNIKNNLNTCIGAINGVIGEMGSLVSAASEGVLTKRGDTEKFQGVYQEMIQGMNGLIDSIADPLADLMACLELMAVNDLTRKMSKDYPGSLGRIEGCHQRCSWTVGAHKGNGYTHQQRRPQRS